MHLFDSLQQRRIRVRRTGASGTPIGVYVCGITPYDTTHVGHAFTYIVFDVLIRHLETVHRQPVRYVQNLTDIDDDVLAKSSSTGEDWRQLGLRWTDRFRADLSALNLRPPDEFPAASAHIPAIQGEVGALLRLGLAYSAGGSVYFRSAAAPQLARFSGLDHAGMLALANARGNHPDDPNKEDPLDFVLWQAASQGEPAWNSPWGPGRPGWHIECSAMAATHLSEPIDIHGGGADLAFPHHACESAQREPLTEATPWVRCWAHVAMVRLDGEKMSKSLGNLVLVRELLEDHHPDTLRLYLLRHHYRTGWDFDGERLLETEPWRRTLEAAVQRDAGTRAGTRSAREMPIAPYGPRVSGALDDDLNTPAALRALLELADDIVAASHGTDVAPAQDLLRTLARDVLGLTLSGPDQPPAEGRPAWPSPVVGSPDIDSHAG